MGSFRVGTDLEILSAFLKECFVLDMLSPNRNFGVRTAKLSHSRLLARNHNRGSMTALVILQGEGSVRAAARRIVVVRLQRLRAGQLASKARVR
jgi:hypothetical protein